MSNLVEEKYEKTDLKEYNSFLGDIKNKIKLSQQKAFSSVNREMIKLYFNIGLVIDTRQKELGWGAKVIDKLSSDISKEFPQMKSFSTRNMKRMLQFYKEYSDDSSKVPPLVAQIPWTHNIILIEKERVIITLSHKEFNLAKTGKSIYLDFPNLGVVKTSIYSIDEHKMRVTLHRFIPKKETPLERKKIRVKVKEDVETPDIAPDVITPDSTFASMPVFKVSGDDFARCKFGKDKFARWARHIDTDSEMGKRIYNYAKKNPKKSIIVQHEKSGHMLYLRKYSKTDGRKSGIMVRKEK